MGWSRAAATDDDAEETDPSALALIKSVPGNVSLESMLTEIGKLDAVRTAGLPDGVFAGIAPKVTTAWRARAAVEAPSHLRSHPEPLTLTLLAALTGTPTWPRQPEHWHAEGKTVIFLIPVPPMSRVVNHGHAVLGRQGKEPVQGLPALLHSRAVAPGGGELVEAERERRWGDAGAAPGDPGGDILDGVLVVDLSEPDRAPPQRGPPRWVR